MPPLPTAASFRDDVLDLVPPLGQGALDPLDEGTKVGVVGPRIHLGNEKDLHFARSLTGRPRARQTGFLPPHTRAAAALPLPVGRSTLSRFTANAIPDRPHPDDGYTLGPLPAVLRRRLNATVLVPCPSDSLTAVLASIF